MSYIIGSFNIQKLGRSSSKDFERIASIIRHEKFDVIAIQEVFAKEGVKSIVNRLGPHWAYAFEATKETIGNCKAQKEGYAFIWNTKRLNLVKSFNSDKPAPSSISVQNRYAISRNWTGAFDHTNKLVRPPMVIRLTPQGTLGGCNFELRLINTHIAFNKPANCLGSDSPGILRNEEFIVLAKKIYASVSTKRYGNNLPAYTILLGDYNICLAGHGNPSMAAELQIGNKRKVRTVQKEKTSLKQAQNATGTDDDDEQDNDIMSDGDFDIYSENYDHFTFDAKYEDEQEITMTASRVEVLGNDQKSLREYRDRVSDHVPIKLEMDIRKGTRR